MINSVIAAVSTPPGKGGVAIIRMSGEGAFDIAEKIFIPRGKKKIAEYPKRYQIYGDIVFNGEHLDDGMMTLFPSPASYTGEDVVEFSIHGGLLICAKVLECLYILGAKAAKAGEFTRRAFINGKLSLTEAEAIGTLLEAKSYEQIKLSNGASRTRLANEIEKQRRAIRELLSSMYARIDYPDEDLGDFSDAECIQRLAKIEDSLLALMNTYRTGKAINEGIDTVICGKPNVGKSSIYNMIFRDDLAIVTDIEGTTRDVLTGQISLGRVLINLSDTAGIRSLDDAETVEKIGIERAKRKVLECELLICVFDNSRPFTKADEEILALKNSVKGEAIAIVNKYDLDAKLDTGAIEKAFDNVIYTSAKEDEESSLAKLTALVERLFTDEKISSSDDPIISTARQNARVRSAYSLISGARTSLEAGVAQDAISSDVELALGEIGELDGRGVSDEVVADIFSKFCVGK